MPDEQEMSSEVHGLVAKTSSREYVEAVIADALKILPSYKHRHDTLVVVNARRIAVILDKQAHRGTVIPVDLIEQVVSGADEGTAPGLSGLPRADVLRLAHRRKLVLAGQRNH